MLPSNILNFKSVKLFEGSRCYQECIAAQEYLRANESNIEGWLNLVVTKEFLNIRVEIDLNYVNIDPSNLTLLGWKIEEPLCIVLDISESKLLNSDEREL